jgi:hypothetical protein
MLDAKNIPRLAEQLPHIYKPISWIQTCLSRKCWPKGWHLRNIKKEDIRYFQLPGKGLTEHDPLVNADVLLFLNPIWMA